MRVQHIIPISGGKDSQATAIIALKRLTGRDTNLPPRFMHCSVGSNENQMTIDHIAYVERALGITIEILTADFSAQIHQRREAIAQEWADEKRIKKHSAECREAANALNSISAAIAMRRTCACPVSIMPPMPDDIIQEAMALLAPTGDPFVDLTILKGLFPSPRARFCTEELKVFPMRAALQACWDDGVSTIEWVGERADESPARAAKPTFQRIRHPKASQIIYRPVHKLTAADVLAISDEAGIAHNPLYRLGAKRVGCWPCLFSGKDEITNIANRTPEHIDRLRQWEALISKVSRRQSATFFHAPNDGMMGIDNIVQWARTSRGGVQYDLLRSVEAFEADRDGMLCDSAYGLCE